jgi:MFS family permease
MLQKFFGDSNIAKKDFLILAILFFSIFGWFYMAQPMINLILSKTNVTEIQKFIVWTGFYGTIIGSSVLGAILSNKINRQKFLASWIFFGMIASSLPALINIFTFPLIFIISIFLGASFGFSMPSFLAFFAESTIVENRGRIGGIAFMIGILIVPILAILFTEFSLASISIIFAAMRGIGLTLFVLKSEKKTSSETKRNISFVSIIRDRTFFLYFIAWFIFPLIDRVEEPILIQFLTEWNTNLISLMEIVEPIVAIISVVIGGLLCDWIGRKKIILSGFVAMGIAYALVGFAPRFDISWYIYFIVDGLAWGILLLIFVIILWGDLSQPGTQEKHYAIGSIPFFLSSIIPMLLTESFIRKIEVSAAFSVASFFLFVAVMPLVFAPETLPEKKMELRRLRKFAEDAKKAKEKYERKMKS